MSVVAQRFWQDEYGGLVKYGGPVEYPLELDMAPFLLRCAFAPLRARSPPQPVLTPRPQRRRRQRRVRCIG